MHSMVVMDIHERTSVWQLSHCSADLWLLLWTRQDRERFSVSSATMVIKTGLCQYTEYRIWTQISRVHSPVVKAADCRSAGPWFNSGRRSWFTFVTGSDNLTNHNIQMINIMSPITTSITTIARKSVKMVAELVKRGQPLKPPSEFGAYAVVGWMQRFGVPMLAGGPAAVYLVTSLKQVHRMPGRLIEESLDRLGNPTFRLALQTQEQHIRLDEGQLTTDTADLKMTDDVLAEDTATFEDTTQDCQAKVGEFEAYTKSLSEDLEALAKAKAVISEKTGDAEYRDNRSMLSSRGGLASSLAKSEHSIELAQLASRVVSAMHAETSNGDDPFAKVKGLISDMIARLEEKASADAAHKATSNVYTVVHRTDGLKTIAKRAQGVSHLFSFFDETCYPDDVHAIITVLKEAGVKSTATPAQLTVDGKVSETFVRTKLFMQQHKSSETSMISLGSCIMKLDSVVYLASCSWPEVMNIMLMCDMKIKWIDESQGVSLKEFMGAQHRNQTEDVKENMLKGLVIVHCYRFDNEMIAVKSYKSSDCSGWNGWQNIVIETEYGYAWVDKADENSQCLETYDAMRKTTESEREAKDQIMEQINKYTRNGGRRYCRILIWLSKFGFLEGPKVETEILSVKMHLTKATSWNQVKSGDDAAEKFVSNDAKKTIAEATQFLKSVLETNETLKTKPQMRKKVHQVKEELLKELSKEIGKDNDKLRNFATRLQQDTRSLETSQLEFQSAVTAKNAEAAKSGIKTPFLEEIMTRGELYFSGAVKRLSDQCSDQCSLPGDTVPAWRDQWRSCSSGW